MVELTQTNFDIPAAEKYDFGLNYEAEVGLDKLRGDHSDCSDKPTCERVPTCER